MTCPKCGNDIPEGLLLCEKCGTEIKIVPDFDIDIENSINETLSSIVEDIEPNNGDEAVDELMSREEKLEDEFFSDKRLSIKADVKPRHIFLILLFIIAVIATAIILVVAGVHNNSYGYQISSCNRKIESGDYDGALKCIERAESLRPHNKAIDAEYAKVYIGLGQDSKAEELLLNDINEGGLTRDELYEFYDILVNYYLAHSDSEKLSSLLDSCGDGEIREHFLKYVALPPEFSIPTGSYAKLVDLTLTANSTGAIYYTLDGSDPSAINGTLYTRPISLGAGEYEFKAVFVNDYGIASAVSASYYLVDAEKPEPPIVTPDSGDYNKMVTVTVSSLPGCDVYYTVDGTDPIPDTALKYEAPVKVPVGHYNYCFVSVSETGVISDVVRRSFNVNLITKYTSTMASYSLLSRLMDLGVIVDASGKSTEGNSVYSYEYDSIVEIKDVGYYYKFDEFLTTEDGLATNTGFYAVDVDQNVPYRLAIGASNEWVLLPLE